MALALSLFLTVAAAPTTGLVPTETALCAIVQNPQAFVDREVRFRAGVLTDWQHGTVLIHSGCGRGIELTMTDAVPREESAAFDRAVGTPLNGGPERTTMATFTGRFLWTHRNREYNFDNPLKFEARRIERIKLYPRRSSN
jgi:hypothetical protein